MTTPLRPLWRSTANQACPMCVRRENEPLWIYALRWATEQPKTLLAIVGLAAASVLYVDFKNYLQEQSLMQQDTVRVLTELTSRIEHIERRLDP